MSRPGFNICVGPDAVLLKDYIDGELKAFPPEAGAAALGAAAPAWEKSTFWGEEPLPADFWEKLTLQGLFDQPEAIILRQAQELSVDTLKKLSAALARGASRVWAFICLEVPYEKGKAKIPAQISKLKFFEFAGKQGWIKEIPPLDQRGIRSFALAEAKKLGLSLGAADLEGIARALPPDAGGIRLEMGKLALASRDGALPLDALELLNFEPEMDIFAFLQALQGARQAEEVWGRYFKDSAKANDAGLFGFLWALLREGRVLWQLLAGEQVFLPTHVLASKTNFARSLGYGGLARIWDLALTAEKGVKSGERSPHQAFEILLADILCLFRRKGQV